MIVAIAAGQQPRLTLDPRVPVETMTAYIVQVSLGDTPAGRWSIGRSSRWGCCCSSAPSCSTCSRTGCASDSGKSIRERPRRPGRGCELRRRRAQDWLFVAFGLLSTLLGLIALGALVLYDVIADGAGRLSWQFLTSYTSRRAAEAGIYAALIGSRS